MKLSLFCHSLISDWNHGNAHFLRGVVAELLARGHYVRVFEPRDGWSLQNLLADQGPAAVDRFHDAFPELESELYSLPELDLDRAFEGTDLVLVHEWNEPELVAAIGEHRRRAQSYALLFHDTHHRAATAPSEMEAFDLGQYDGVLAFGRVIRDLYLQKGWTERAWTWHEAADQRVFYPRDPAGDKADLVWVGNWGDEERSEELEEFLLGPARSLQLTGTVHGVGYPSEAVAAVKGAGLRYGGWLANHRVPDVFARHTLTIHVPRKPYVRALPGIPTIRVFEALACGIPLICAPWEDCEGLFRPHQDYLIAHVGSEMTGLI